MNGTSKGPVEADVEVLPPERDGWRRETRRGSERPAAGEGGGATASSLPPSAPHGLESIVRAVAYLLDDLVKVPGTKFRFGLDPLIGLIPGIGGGASGLLSCLTLLEAARRGLPKIVIARMAANILVNTVADSVPVAGDLFSAFFKSNRINYDLLKKHTAALEEKTVDPLTGRARRQGTTSDWLFVLVLIVALLIVVGLFVGTGVWLAGKLWNRLV